MRTRRAKTFDTVKMVRSIRDRIYEETKDLNAEERIAYFHKHGQAATLEQPTQGCEETVNK